MHIVPPSAARRRLRALNAFGLMLLSAVSAASEAPADEPPDALAAPSAPAVDVEQPDGTTLAGRLVRIDGTAVTVDVSGETRVLPLDQVRRLVRTTGPAGQGRPLLLTCTDGSTIAGDDFSWDGGMAVVARTEGPVQLPIGRVRSIAWNEGVGESTVSHWLASIPESTASDLVVVRGSATAAAKPAESAAVEGRPADGGAVDADTSPFEFVECAIASVSADRVTVVLDGETIPVKRTKVIGLHWLRDAAPSGGIRIDVDGGSLRAGTVSWSPQGLVVDGDVRLPAVMLAGVDYAAGRRASLESLPTERLDVEPWFGGLGKVDGLSAFFAPRAVPAGGQWPKPGLLMRPRTVAVWRLPADARRFRAVLSPAAGRQAAGGAVVAVVVDDREVFRRRIDHDAIGENPAGPGAVAGIPLDLDIAGGRRLSICVDFCGPGETHGAIRFTEPIIEK